MECDKIARTLGYCIPIETMQTLTALVDVDNTATLNQCEFRKLLRLHDSQEISDALALFGRKAGLRKALSFDRLDALLSHLGLLEIDWKTSVKFHDGAIVQAEDRQGESFVTALGFKQILQHERSRMRERVKSRWGFSDVEIVELRDVFLNYALDKKTGISAREQTHFIMDYFPEFIDAEARAPLLEIVHDLNVEPGGSMDFPCFCKYNRRLFDWRRQKNIQEEQAIARKASLSMVQMMAYRAFFNELAGRSGELSIWEVKRMLHEFIPKGDKYTREFVDTFREHAITNGDVIDFSGFLLLLCKLMDSNFANIIDISSWDDAPKRVDEAIAKASEKARASMLFSGSVSEDEKSQ